MNVDKAMVAMNQDAMDTPVDTPKSTEVDQVSLTRLDRLRERVLDMLKAPDPVSGIYAMYGSHERHPQQCIPEE